MSDTESDVSAIVVDNGAYMCKAGFAGDDAPRAVFPAVVGTPKHDPLIVGSRYKDTYVEDEAQVKRDILTLRNPIEHPEDPNWDDMEKIWHHVFYNELRVDPQDYHILLTENPLNPKRCREMMAQIMFENFKVPGINLSIDATLSLIASGRVTGAVFDSGYNASYAVPIHEGHVLSDAVKRLDLGGKGITDYLCKLLLERGYYNMTSSIKRHINDMKDRLCYTAMDYDAEMKSCTESSDKDKTYQLPDGTSITIRNERFRCVEAMFKPFLMGGDDKGAHHVICASLMHCDDIQNDLFKNIVLSGSSTMFPGFKDRLENELNHLVPETLKVNVTAPPERKMSVWIGGSVLASLSNGAKWITKREYEEIGPSIVNTSA